MLYRSLFAAALISGLAFAPLAEAGHSDPTVRLGVDVIWGGGYLRPAPVAWYPAPVYSYAPPPVYGRPYRAASPRYYRHNDRHDRGHGNGHDKRHGKGHDKGHDRRGRDD